MDRQAPPARSRAAAIYADVGCPRDAHAGSIQFALLSAVLVVALVLHEPRQNSSCQFTSFYSIKRPKFKRFLFGQF